MFSWPFSISSFLVDCFPIERGGVHEAHHRFLPGSRILMLYVNDWWGQRFQNHVYIKLNMPLHVQYKTN
jgi:hypothetical protein